MYVKIEYVEMYACMLKLNMLKCMQVFLCKNVSTAQKISLPIRASAKLKCICRKPFFQKFTCRGKRISAYVGAYATGPRVHMPPASTRGHAVTLLLLSALLFSS